MRPAESGATNVETARFGRREWLKALGAFGGAALLSGCYAGVESEDDGVCTIAERPDVTLPPGDWFRGARVAGLAAFAGATVCDIGPELDRMAREHVSVVEVDSELSSYLDEAAFSEQLRVCDLVARECHARKMRCVAYYPVLETLTPDADTTAHTMAKDHPDWIQIGIDGKPNTFIGGGGRVFWVAPGEESAWTCPTSGYVDYFNERVRRLARTALDGLWGDVPLLSDIASVFPCVNATCNAKFRADTGLPAPTAVNFDDPVFLQWISWRHRLIWELEQRIVESAKRARSDFEVIIETVTMDYSAGTVQGLDGAFADDGRVLRVWEIDVVSDATAMRGASEDDWYSLAAMFKHARGCSEPRPAWAFCYGLEDDDAERVMGLCIATGSSPYETKIPEINTSVGTAYRAKMFGWLAEHPELLLARSANPAAILYSSAARDLLDRARGVGLFTSKNLADPLWWSDQEEDSAKQMDYVADYRGFCKLLFQRHVPFDVVTTPHIDATTLSRYESIVAPSLAGIATPAIDAILAWVRRGGSLVLTGPEAGITDERGRKRAAPALLAAFGLSSSTDPAAEGFTEKAVGAGRVLHTPARYGKSYFASSGAVPAELGAFLSEAVTTDAPKGVLVELRTADTGAFVVAFANLDGLGLAGAGGAFVANDASFACAVRLPKGRAVTSVTLTAPGAPERAVPFTVVDDRVRFSVAMHAVAAAIVTFA